MTRTDPRQSPALLLEDLFERRRLAELRVADAQCFQDSGRLRGHTDAVQVDTPLDIRSPGDEGRLEPRAVGQVSVLPGYGLQRRHRTTRRRGAEVVSVGRIQRELRGGFDQSSGDFPAWREERLE